jgi:hypothetical protein
MGWHVASIEVMRNARNIVVQVLCMEDTNLRDPDVDGIILSFSGEGPRSRRYGRTTALRLVVEPLDEDEADE